MLRLVYTGAKGFMQPQTDPNASLGGYMSSTILPNGREGNMFGEVSYLGITNEYAETKGLILNNYGTDYAQNVSIGVLPNTPTRNYNILVAIAQLLPDNQQMEKINNMRDLPYYAEFSEKYMENETDYANMYNIGDMAAGASLAIWVQRKLLNLPPQLLDGETLSDYYDRIQNLPKTDGFQFVLRVHNVPS